MHGIYSGAIDTLLLSCSGIVSLLPCLPCRYGVSHRYDHVSGFAVSISSTRCVALRILLTKLKKNTTASYISSTREFPQQKKVNNVPAQPNAVHPATTYNVGRMQPNANSNIRRELRFIVRLWSRSWSRSTLEIGVNYFFHRSQTAIRHLAFLCNLNGKHQLAM